MLGIGNISLRSRDFRPHEFQVSLFRVDVLNRCVLLPDRVELHLPHRLHSSTQALSALSTIRQQICTRGVALSGKFSRSYR